MGIEIPAEWSTWLKAIAAIIAILTAYGAKGDGLRAMLSKFMPKSVQNKQVAANQDLAYRQLVNDSLARNCAKSVELQDEWMAIRNVHGLKKKPKESLPIE
jgi:hypothetical protein